MFCESSDSSVHAFPVGTVASTSSGVSKKTHHQLRRKLQTRKVLLNWTMREQLVKSNRNVLYKPHGGVCRRLSPGPYINISRTITPNQQSYGSNFLEDKISFLLQLETYIICVHWATSVPRSASYPWRSRHGSRLRADTRRGTRPGTWRGTWRGAWTRSRVISSGTPASARTSTALIPSWRGTTVASAAAPMSVAT